MRCKRRYTLHKPLKYDKGSIQDVDILREAQEQTSAPEVLLDSNDEVVEIESVKEEPVVESSAPVEEPAEQTPVEGESASMPTPPDSASRAKDAVSPLDLIKQRKSGSQQSLLKVIESRKRGGNSQMSVTDLIASRRSGKEVGMTVQDMIFQRKYSNKKTRVL